MKVAIIQKQPVFLDKHKTIDLALECIEESVSNGAELLVFTETFIAGYPTWVWKLKPGPDWGTNEEIHSRLLASSVDLDSDDLNPLYEAAKKHNITIVCGVNERAAENSNATIYNTVLTIGPEGLLNRHRKLMPTNPERMVWGFGDATGLKVTETKAGKISTLICWENYMPLARYALYAQGVQIYIAPTYASGDGWISTMRHIALEGRCWVIGSGNYVAAGKIPEDFPDRENVFPDPSEICNNGDSVVVAPDGKIVTGPLRGEEGILYADIDVQAADNAKRTLDVCGHYSRPDIFNLTVNRTPQNPVKFRDS